MHPRPSVTGKSINFIKPGRRGYHRISAPATITGSHPSVGLLQKSNDKLINSGNGDKWLVTKQKHGAAAGMPEGVKTCLQRNSIATGIVFILNNRNTRCINQRSNFRAFSPQHKYYGCQGRMTGRINYMLKNRFPPKFQQHLVCSHAPTCTGGKDDSGNGRGRHIVSSGNLFEIIVHRALGHIHESRHLLDSAFKLKNPALFHQLDEPGFFFY